MADESYRRPGFTMPGVAAAAAKKNHELGTAHHFTSDSARAAGRKSGETRREAKEMTRHVSRDDAT